MISMILTVPAGNALRIWLVPPFPAKRIRLLRKDADDFAGWDDPDAFVVLDGLERYVTDYTALIDGEAVFYRAFYWNGTAWASSEPKQAVSQANHVAIIVDPLSVLRDRLELGLKPYVSRGDILHERGYIPVLTSSPQVEEVPFPLVTLHLANDAPDVRALGEEVSIDVFDQATGLWRSAEGVLARTDITVVGWSLNGDERLALRNAMKAVLLANLPIFEAAGMQTVSFSFTDLEDYETYAAPMFQAVGSFNCLAFAGVETTDAPIREVVATLQE